MRLRNQLASAVLALLLLLLTAALSSAQTARTYITLSFDDGLATQFAYRGLLEERGLEGIFYVSSGKVGQPGYMSWEQVGALAGEGHEIGGHTLDHRALPALSEAEQLRQVCDDRQALLARGYDARSFAYPFGLQDAAVQAVVASCGYDTARTTGGLDEPPDCCEYAERLRPPRPYRLRAIMQRLSTPLETYKDVIRRARDGSGGWLLFVLHDICSDDCEGFGEFATRADLLGELLDWIALDPHLRVRTPAQVLAIGSDETAPSVELTAPAENASVVTAATIALSAQASDAVGVEAVEFLVDGEVVGRDASAPYGVAWTAPQAAGEVAVSARGFDEAANAMTTSSRTLAVVIPPPDPPDRPGPPAPGPGKPPAPPVRERPTSPVQPHPPAVEPPMPIGPSPPAPDLRAPPAPPRALRVAPPSPPAPSVRIARPQWRGGALVVRVVTRYAARVRRARLLLDRRVVRTRDRGSFTVLLRPRVAGSVTLVAEILTADGTRLRSAPVRVLLSGAGR